MPDWVTYRLSDFLLFSARTYYRMFELYHREIWPAQAVIVAFALALIFILRHNDEVRGRAVAGLLALSWVWVAVAFHLARYAEINWAARYFAVAFIVQAILLTWHGVIRQRLFLGQIAPSSRRIWPSLLLIVLVLETILGLSAGRSWRQLEFPGLTPDATAIATLFIVSSAAPAAPRIALAIPILWCAIGGATLWALGSPEAWVLSLALILGLGATITFPRATATETQS